MYTEKASTDYNLNRPYGDEWKGEGKDAETEIGWKDMLYFATKSKQKTQDATRNRNRCKPVNISCSNRNTGKTNWTITAWSKSQKGKFACLERFTLTELHWIKLRDIARWDHLSC